jgi:hypothetical protein
MWQKMLLEVLEAQSQWRKVDEEGVEGAVFVQQLRTEKATRNVAIA